ncbi:MAG: hypothetical protein ACREP1_08910, partial [Rhodanobacteraceae bacterium]
SIMRQDARPLLEIGCGLEDGFARRAYEDGIAGLHDWRESARQDMRRAFLRNAGTVTELLLFARERWGVFFE